MKLSALAAAAAALVFSACSGGGPAPEEADQIPVGVLHSLSGTMAISEIPVRDATLLAIEEINAAGGVLGKPLAPIVEDGASEPAVFAQKAQKLIQQDGAPVVFGGWTSASRKAMLPVFEANDALLWYPVQFEGNECSPAIFYLGAQPNQQILPALDWAFEQGRESIYLLGSDYVFPRTANLILKKHIEDRGGTVAGEDYVPLGGTDFSSVINKIQAASPDIVFNTLNGDSNVAFFKQLQAEGLGPDELPTISFSIAEQEAKAMGPELLAGHYAAWNYFQTLETPANGDFVAAYRSKYGAGEVLDDPMEAGYIAVHLWKKAVEAAGTTDPEAVRAAARGVELAAPEGPVAIADNQSLHKAVRVGQLLPDGQFEVIWGTDEPVAPEPYDPLAFPGKTCSWGD